MTFKSALTVLALSLSTASAAGMMLGSTDKAFLPKATAGNEFELQAAQLAQSMGKSAAVKSYAEKMISDHTKLGADVMAAVKKADPSMMMTPKVNAAQQKMLDALKASGNKFDAMYKKDMTASHAQTYALFQKYARSGRANADLKKVVQGALPTVKMHLDMAKMLPSS